MIAEAPHKRLIREKTYSGFFPSWKYATPVAYDCTLERDAIAVLEADAGIVGYLLIEDIGHDLIDLKVRSVIAVEARGGSKKLLCLAYVDCLTWRLVDVARRLRPPPDEYDVDLWTPAILAQDHRVATATSLVLGATKRADHDLRDKILDAFQTTAELSLGGLVGRDDDHQARRAQVYALILEGTLQLSDPGARLDDGALLTLVTPAREAGTADAKWDAAA